MTIIDIANPEYTFPHLVYHRLAVVASFMKSMLDAYTHRNPRKIPLAPDCGSISLSA